MHSLFPTSVAKVASAPTDTTPIPNHVAIVPDGNRRWARRIGVSTYEAYVAAAFKALDAATWCRDVGIRHLSAFALSQENVAMRPDQEVEAIRLALMGFFENLKATDYVRLHLFGDLVSLLEVLPSWRPLLAYDEAPRATPLTVHIGINYSGKAEIHTIARTARRLSTDPERYHLKDSLLLSAGVPEVDLVFRAGGQQRLSGLLPFQTAYAELWFTPTLWPDITRHDFERGLEWYAKQERRLGE